VFGDDDGRWSAQQDLPASEDVRLRVAGASTERGDVELLTREVLALYTCGPAGGGGVRTAITPRLASDSCFVPRDWLRTGWSFVE